MNIDQRFRSIIWPLAVFFFINTLAIILFVTFGLDSQDNSLASYNSIFRISVLVLSLLAALMMYKHLRNIFVNEQQELVSKRHEVTKHSPTKKLVIVLENIAIGLLQALFVFISSMGFWLIVTFTKEAVTFNQAFAFYLGFGLILLASAYTITHRMALAVLAVRK